MILAWTTLSLAIFSFFLAIYFIKRSSSNKQVKKHMESWFVNEKKKERSSFIVGIGDKYDQSELAEELSKKLVQAHIPLKASEYAGICIMLFFLLWFVNHFILSLVFPLDASISYFIVWLGSKFLLKSRQNKRSENFNKQLPNICRMMSNSVKAGLTIPQGIEMIAQEVKAPAGPEFKKIDQQLSLGDDFEEVMMRLRDRFDSKDLHIFVSTLLIQRKVGGNLAEVLSLMAQTLEERARVSKEIDTVTAEAKFISYILPVMPIMMAMMMNLFIPGFLNPLFTPFGLILLAVFLGMQFIAFLLIKKITRIRV
jgi:tight adherence protein B